MTPKPACSCPGRDERMVAGWKVGLAGFEPARPGDMSRGCGILPQLPRTFRDKGFLPLSGS